MNQKLQIALFPPRPPFIHLTKSYSHLILLLLLKTKSYKRNLSLTTECESERSERSTTICAVKVDNRVNVVNEGSLFYKQIVASKSNEDSIYSKKSKRRRKERVRGSGGKGKQRDRKTLGLSLFLRRQAPRKRENSSASADRAAECVVGPRF